MTDIKLLAYASGDDDDGWVPEVTSNGKSLWRGTTKYSNRALAVEAAEANAHRAFTALLSHHEAVLDDPGGKFRK